MRGAHEELLRFVEEFSFVPVQFGCLMTALIDVGMQAPLPPHDERLHVTVRLRFLDAPPAHLEANATAAQQALAAHVHAHIMRACAVGASLGMALGVCLSMSALRPDKL